MNFVALQDSHLISTLVMDSLGGVMGDSWVKQWGQGGLDRGWNMNEGVVGRDGIRETRDKDQWCGRREGNTAPSHTAAWHRPDPLDSVHGGVLLSFLAKFL